MYIVRIRYCGWQHCCHNRLVFLFCFCKCVFLFCFQTGKSLFCVFVCTCVLLYNIRVCIGVCYCKWLSKMFLLHYLIETSTTAAVVSTSRGAKQDDFRHNPRWPPPQWSFRSIGIEVVNVGVSSSSCFFIFSICCSL